MKKITVFILIVSFFIGFLPAYAQTVAPAFVEMVNTTNTSVPAPSYESSNISEASEGHTSTPTPTQDVTVFFKADTSVTDTNSLVASIGADKTWAVFPGQGFNAHLSQQEIDALSKNPAVATVEPVRTIEVSDENVNRIVGAQNAWTRQVNGVPMNGSGQTICIVDTGVDFTHPSLTHANILGHNLDCFNSVNGNCVDNGVTDQNGHGTHVAGIAAANGAVVGVAPGANVISMKVFNGSSGNLDTPFPIQNAVNWCRNHANQYNISAISMSLGAQIAYRAPPAPTTCDDISYFNTINAEINAASNLNVSVTAASGNQGASNTINWPACLNRVIAVGATNMDDTLASYSNYDSLVKLFAPGTGVVSTALNGGTMTQTGTSMATPAVAASIAILNQYFQASGEGIRTHTPESNETLLYTNGFHFSPSIDASRINVDSALLSVDHIAPQVMASTSAATIHVQQSVTYSCSATDWQLSNITLNVHGASNRINFQSSAPVTGTLGAYSASFTLPKVSTYNFTCTVSDTHGNVTTSPVSQVTVTG